MTEHTIDLTDEQAQLAADGQLTEIRIPIEGLPQARRGEFKMIRMEWHVEWQLFAGTDFIQSVIPIFEIGDTIRGREAWAKHLTAPNVLTKPEYSALAELVGDTCYVNPIDIVKWRPASDMPDEAIRHEFTVTGVEAEKLVTKCTEHTNCPFYVANAEGEFIKTWHWMIALEAK